MNVCGVPLTAPLSLILPGPHFAVTPDQNELCTHEQIGQWLGVHVRDAHPAPVQS